LVGKRVPATAATVVPPKAIPPAPVAGIDVVRDTYFGETLSDPYRWMENDKDPEWLPFLKGENDHARAVLDVAKGANLPETIGNTQAANPQWLDDGSGLFYNQLTGAVATPERFLDCATWWSRMATAKNPSGVRSATSQATGPSRASTPIRRCGMARRTPAVLLTTGVTDPRVAPFHVGKLTARLQAASSSGKPILLRVDYDAGHGIGSTRAQQDREAADTYALLLWRLRPAV